MNALILCGEGQEIHLHGAASSAPVRRARRVECKPVDGGWREKVEVYLEGLPADSGELRARIERLLATAQRGEDARVKLIPYPGAEVVEARLAGGMCETLAWNSGGTCALRLELVRREAWLSAEVELPLSNPNGYETTGGLVIYPFNDGAHGNYADIHVESVRGDRPGALRLEVENLSAGESLRDLVTCLDTGEGACDAVDWLEGEDASGGSLVTQAGCSSGTCREVETGNEASAVLSWELEGERLARLSGRDVRPVVRFASPPPVGSVWAWWQWREGAQRVGESEHELLSGAVLQALPALSAPAGVTLELWARTTSGTASFSLDWVQLCPLDGWREYRAVLETPPGGVLVEDGYAQRAYTRTAAGEWLSHAGRGKSLELRPGRGQRVYLLHGGSVDLPVRVRMWYRPAWGSV